MKGAKIRNYNDNEIGKDQEKRMRRFAALFKKSITRAAKPVIKGSIVQGDVKGAEMAGGAEGGCMIMYTVLVSATAK